MSKEFMISKVYKLKQVLETSSEKNASSPKALYFINGLLSERQPRRVGRIRASTLLQNWRPQEQNV